MTASESPISPTATAIQSETRPSTASAAIPSLTTTADVTFCRTTETVFSESATR